MYLEHLPCYSTRCKSIYRWPPFGRSSRQPRPGSTHGFIKIDFRCSFLWRINHFKSLHFNICNVYDWTGTQRHPRYHYFLKQVVVLNLINLSSLFLIVIVGSVTLNAGGAAHVSSNIIIHPAFDRESLENE